ncbi:MAG TPA: DUF59 domain-containing protein [Terriglobales bacterium]|nr:DUF59 domain-containing protein [Terriglobales bacterium]
MDDFRQSSQGEHATKPQEELKERVIAALHRIHDPEIPVNIYDLGLVYGVDVSTSGDVHVRMTLTTPGCPLADSFPEAVQDALKRVSGVANVEVEIVWDPPWTPERMSKFAKRELGMT